MLKSVSLKFSKIKYSGDSVGRDIRIEIEVFDGLFKIDTRINSGETKVINQEIYKIETDQKLLQSSILLTIIEKDLLFNDTGNKKDNIKIDINLTKPQPFVFEVEIKESRSFLRRLFWGTRKAIFEVELEAQIGEIERYAPETKDGWLLIRDADDKETTLPAYIKVNLKHVKNKREYFVPTEGVHRGELLSVELKSDGSSYLVSGVQHKPMVQATYSISKKIFTLNGKQYKTIDYPEALWKKGIYNIEIPDFPHGDNDRYAEAIKQKVWFRVDFEEARYLHPGVYSLGCLTIIETTRWMEIYSTLIKARKGDLKSVGVIKIVD